LRIEGVQIAHLYLRAPKRRNFWWICRLFTASMPFNHA
jgi:hypothetical protein